MDQVLSFYTKYTILGLRCASSCDGLLAGLVDPCELLAKVESVTVRTTGEKQSRREVLDDTLKWHKAGAEEQWLAEYEKVGWTLLVESLTVRHIRSDTAIRCSHVIPHLPLFRTPSDTKGRVST